MVAVPPASAATAAAPVPEAQLAAPSPPPGSTPLGPVAASAVLEVDVVLAPAHPAAVASLVAPLYAPGSPEYHHWLTPAQSAQVFAPAPAVVAGVSSWLHRVGLT